VADRLRPACPARTEHTDRSRIRHDYDTKNNGLNARGVSWEVSWRLYQPGVTVPELVMSVAELVMSVRELVVVQPGFPLSRGGRFC